MNLKPEVVAPGRRRVLFPVFLKLEGRSVLVVGGGRVAEEKLDALLRSAGDVTVIAPEISPRIAAWVRRGLLRHIAAEYRQGSVTGYFLVIACTNCKVVNHGVFAECRKAGILCNVVDDLNDCDFYASAVVRRGDLQIAISTGGNSPALARQIRMQLEREFGPEYGPWTGWLGRMRSALRQALPHNQNTRDLLHLLAKCRPRKLSQHHGPVREVANMSHELTRSELATRIREVLKDHQRDGLNMIGSVDKLVNRLVVAVNEWVDELHQKKSA